MKPTIIQLLKLADEQIKAAVLAAGYEWNADAAAHADAARDYANQAYEALKKL